MLLALVVTLAGCTAAKPAASGATSASHSPSGSTTSGSATSGSTTASRTTTGAAAGQLSLVAEPDQGLAPIYALIASAHRSIDLTMYELVDTDAELALELAAGRGVNVRVLLDVNREKSANLAAFTELTDMRVHVAWADPRYAATHQKTLVVDDSVAAVMTLNMTSRYYSSTRDFAVIDRNSSDVAAIEQVFNADFAHQSTTPRAANDLVWSPKQSEPALLSLIGSATSSLLVENEEMADKTVTAALVSAARRGVRVVVVMTDQTDWHSAFDTLVAAHAVIRVYAANASLYIHAKVVVADAGTPHQRAFVGSENFSNASLNRNRELGIETSDPAIVTGLTATLNSDAAGAEAWAPS
jgi:phosphatidylserine/phosphatidylglycerophosphate/cardiolipin synthase-like enzyme